MPRIILTTDPSPLPADTTVWLDEHLQSVHLSTPHAAAQLIERLAWAIADAEVAERERAEHGARSSRQSRRSRSSTHRGATRARRSIKRNAPRQTTLQ
jgi:hypothetical protein